MIDTDLVQNVMYVSGYEASPAFEKLFTLQILEKMALLLVESDDPILMHLGLLMQDSTNHALTSDGFPGPFKDNAKALDALVGVVWNCVGLSITLGWPLDKKFNAFTAAELLNTQTSFSALVGQKSLLPVDDLAKHLQAKDS